MSEKTTTLFELNYFNDKTPSNKYPDMTVGEERRITTDKCAYERLFGKGSYDYCVKHYRQRSIYIYDAEKKMRDDLSLFSGYGYDGIYTSCNVTKNNLSVIVEIEFRASKEAMAKYGGNKHTNEYLSEIDDEYYGNDGGAIKRRELIEKDEYDEIYHSERYIASTKDEYARKANWEKGRDAFIKKIKELYVSNFHDDKLVYTYNDERQYFVCRDIKYRISWNIR